MLFRRLRMKLFFEPIRLFLLIKYYFNSHKLFFAGQNNSSVDEKLIKKKVIRLHLMTLLFYESSTNYPL